MKLLLIIIGALVIFSCKLKMNVLDSNLHNSSSEGQKSHTIVNIDSINDVYLIYAKRNDSIFKIASVIRESNDCKKVEIGENYNFEIHSYFRADAQRLDIKGIGVTESTIVNLENENGIIWDLFWTDDLKGLCYIKKK